MNHWDFTQIPKIAHFYWGVGRLPLSRYLTLWSFKQQNPDWKMRLYRPIAEDSFGRVYSANYDGECYMEMAARICDVEEVDFGVFSMLWDVHKSDLLRWHLLSTVGGIWSDMDIFYLNPSSNIKTDVPCDGSAVELLLCFDNTHHFHSIGFIGASQSQVEMREISSASAAMFEKDSYQSIGSHLLGGLGIDYAYMKNHAPRISNLNFFQIYQLGPWAIEVTHGRKPACLDRSSIVGMHWYAGSPLSEPFQNARNVKEISELGSYLSNAVAESGYRPGD